MKRDERFGVSESWRLPWALWLLAVPTGCEAMFPVDRFMDGPDSSPSAIAASPRGDAAGAAPGLPGLGDPSVLDGNADPLADAAVDSEPLDSTLSGDSLVAPVATGDGASSEVVYRSSSSARSVTATLTVPLPTGVVIGDLLWLTLYTDHATSTVSTPSGWTREGTWPNAAADFHVWWFYRFVVASEPGSAEFTATGSLLNVAALVAFGGVDRSAPFQADIAADVSGSPFAAPSLATTSPNLVLVTSFINDGGDGATWDPSPPLVGLVNRGIVFVGEAHESDAGLNGAGSAKCTHDGSGVVSVVALNPAGTQGNFHPGAIGNSSL